MIMEREKIFVHISDMHVAECEHPGRVPNSRAKQTHLTAPPKDDGKNYIESICKIIKDNYKNSEYYLLVSGDIADSAEQKEYEAAKSYLEIIFKELDIDKKRILLVPGNHDINRGDCMAQAKTKDSCNAYDCNDKYNCFAEFYQQLLSKPFPQDEAIVDHLVIESDRLLFVGINTNFHIDYKGGEGYVDIDKLDRKMKELEKYNSTYTKIALFHHNIYSYYKNNSSSLGNFDEDNRNRFLGRLMENGFRCVFSGNEHTPSSENNENDHNENDHNEKSDIYYSDAGSLGLKARTDPVTNDFIVPLPSFKLYILEKNDKGETIFKDIVYRHKNDNHKKKPAGSWVCESEDEIVLRGPVATKTLPSVKGSLPAHSDSDEDHTKKALFSSSAEKENNPETPFQKDLLKIIKKNGLYHQGHFHWGKSSRSHNWIDTVTLLGNNENKKKILDEIDRYIKDKGIDYDIVIGIGIEGNILSSRLLLKDKDYTYIPYAYRYDDATKYEQAMHVQPHNYKNALIITDVVFSGNTLRTLLEEKEHDFFKNKVEHVDILSLFYTASEDDLKKGGPLKELGCIGDKVAFHYLSHLEVGRCIYEDGGYKRNCPNYKNHLCEVLRFYNENEE